MNTNIANQIVSVLEDKGESKDYIIGFLTATLNSLRHLDNDPKAINDYLDRTLKQAKQ